MLIKKLKIISLTQYYEKKRKTKLRLNSQFKYIYFKRKRWKLCLLSSPSKYFVDRNVSNCIAFFYHNQNRISMFFYRAINLRISLSDVGLKRTKLFIIIAVNVTHHFKFRKNENIFFINNYKIYFLTLTLLIFI